jgi:hypothetical protein
MNAFSFPRTLAVLLLTATTARAELMNYGTDDSDDSTLVSAEDLESCGCENTSGVTLGNGSSSQFSATSMSSDDCGPFDTSLTAVLGAGVSDGLPPEFYFGGAVGMILISGGPATLQYDFLEGAGISIATNIEIGGEVVAGIQPGGDYKGRPFAFTYGGVTYCGTFVDGLVSFVPEPSTACILLTSLACGGYSLWTRRRNLQRRSGRGA